MASWYRRFIPHYAEIIEPLNRLLRRKKVGIGNRTKRIFRENKETFDISTHFDLPRFFTTIPARIPLSLRKRILSGGMGD